ncbi:hypothetical protein IFM89_016885 [Coptis chinensis]|uniref:TLDc domain-containing protein n=1 Tax=Coptis chinensis TaxID=261450 RepID=A0A835I2S3_9MAGN|nr:hypothetical protein IFM89_016885 [Coptis chinensis]
MYGWKERVADKLSRILSDSPPPSSSSAAAVELSSDPDHSARPLSKEEPHGTGKSLTSYIYSFVPNVSLDGYKSNKRRHDLRPFRSLSNKWRSKTSSPKDKPLECDPEHIPPCDSAEIMGKSEEERNMRASVKKTSTPHLPVDYVSNLMDKSSFISSDLYDFLQSSLPNIVTGCQWVLLYSTLRDGISLRTLLRKSVDLPGPCLLIVGDMQGAIFGGLLEGPLKPTAKRKYQGTHQTFVFTTIYGQPRLFRATGANRYYYLCLNDFLAFGGGGNFALCLDEDLLQGTSGPCDTFGNLCLAHSPEFELKNVELWGFTHSSKYVT